MRQHFPGVMDAYSGLRRALEATGPLTRRERELIMLAGFTVGREEGGYRAHARFALENGATPEEVRQATLLVFGASAPIELVAEAINWADEVIAVWEAARVAATA